MRGRADHARIAHRSRDADTPADIALCPPLFTARLGSRFLGNYASPHYGDTESDGRIRPAAIIFGHRCCNFTAILHGAVNAVEHYKCEFASGLDNPTAMLVERWVY
jgi:hypothetical protein